MSEFKGTKGKWEVDPTQAISFLDMKPLYYYVSINGQFFISTHKNITLGIDDNQQKANALLISKAPEMLEMLKKLVERLEENDLGRLNAVFQAKQLINEATQL